ncbi:hypothetical protein [Rhizobium sp. MHM7A]|uniref:hypothetical protein n=1 Tax=Rhizobium sp. MHM7A TaxID=2583233 RepID=UPI001105B111|nr:hypothetical protein [Rhizobium sp. MHM7A]TLX16982.1 hypothetical protein FFR93_06590 [Rhizobium sp. MHM7A]
MTTEIAVEQEFYKTFYFNHSVCIDGQWYHGTTAAELEADVETNEGKGSFEKFLTSGGQVEYPIYGVPVASGSMWVEDAKSPEDGVKRVKELQDEASKFYKGYSEEIKTRVLAKREHLWGPGALTWHKGSIERLVDDVALSIAIEMKDSSISTEEATQISEFAAEILFLELQRKMPSDDEIPAISKLATLSARANGNDISADVQTYVKDEFVKLALAQEKITLNDVVPFTVYLKAFDRHAFTDFMNNEFRNEHEDVLVNDFIGLKKKNLTGMPLIEAAQEECDRLAQKYGLERYPTGY